MSREIVLVGACRTAIGKLNGALSNVRASTLGAKVIKGAINKSNMPIESIDQIIMGSVLQAGLGQNIARQAAIEAGLPNHIPAQTINMVCGSGLQAISLASSIIKSGQADVIVAGGVENMSQAPYLLKQARTGYVLGHEKIYDSLINDGLWDSFGDYHMGVTAENVAEKYEITRKEQDRFAFKM